MKLQIPIYGGELWLFKTKAEFLNAQEELGDTEEIKEHTLGDAWAIPHPDEKHGLVYLIGVYDNDLGTLIHELSHTTLNIIENAGFSAHEGNGEPFSYLINYLFDNVYKWFVTELTEIN